MKTRKKRPGKALAVTAGVIVLAAVAGGIAAMHASQEKQRLKDRMTVLTEDRTQILRDYVRNAEQTLLQYSEADQIKNLFRDPENAKLFSQAQAYTEEFSRDNNITDGVYAGDCDTRILVHSTDKVVGMVTRADPGARRVFQESLKSAGDSVYNAGLVVSPSLGRTALCMYKAFYDETGELAGYAGLNMLPPSLSLPLDESTYRKEKIETFTIVNVADQKYILDYKTPGAPVENEKIAELCSTLSGTDAPASGTFEYRDDWNKFLVSYSYMPEYGWLLLLDARL